jgi:hypothetical protein
MLPGGFDRKGQKEEGKAEGSQNSGGGSQKSCDWRKNGKYLGLGNNKGRNHERVETSGGK